jgi:hypothetical protein
MNQYPARRALWVALGFAGVVLLAACGSALTGLGVADPVVEQPLPTPKDAVVAEQGPVTAPTTAVGSQESMPTAATIETPTAGVAIEEPIDNEVVAEGPTTASETVEPEGDLPEGVVTEDDRPDRLRRITGSWNTDWSKHIIDYGEIQSGGPPRDGIPSIDEPKFISPDEAAQWLADNEPVVALEINGDARAYPLQILTWHEIVNDVVGDLPVIVTFCPLCNSAIAFDRTLSGEVYEFGTSGLLRNSDLIMYDRTTESLWQQFTGEAIVGELVGQELTFLPSSMVGFADFRAAHPEGVVLSRDTGFSRAYGRNPYAGYDRIGQTPFLFDGELDERLAAMSRVVTVSLEDPSGEEVDVAYPLSILAEVSVINDTQAGRDLVLFHTIGTSSALDTSAIAEGTDVGATGVFDANLGGQKLTFGREGDKVVDEETGSTWNVLGQAVDGPLAGERLVPVVHGDQFWFAWAAFKPDTVIYGSD